MLPAVRGTSVSPSALTTDDAVVTRAGSDGTKGASVPDSKSLAKQSSVPSWVGREVRDGVPVDDGVCVPVCEDDGVLVGEAVAVSLRLVESVAEEEAVPVADSVTVPKPGGTQTRRVCIGA
jgi:hypothetical protein